ncbi:MAG TPA: RNA 2',3'-cyclic phosphodiesterase [Candidatus Baltobacteraceae bacterium]|nr:RNA 2',3'-cyclic phosphodiesterase [Candidatus Baltobacteraceae bacterium]
MPHRPKLFAGIELDKRVRAQCASVAARLAAHGFDARFEPPEKLHITLAFLGWVDYEQFEPITDALRTAADTAPPFTLTLDTIGAFPHERRPKIVWIGSRDQGAPYRRLAYGARAAFEELGFSFDKDAVAHVTIGRVKGGHAHLPMLEVPPMQVHVTEIVLFESLPAGPTTRYEVRHRAPLNPNA